MKRVNGFLFFEILLLLLTVSLREFLGYGMSALTLKGIYGIILLTNLWMFLIISKARHWAWDAMYLVFVYVLLLAGAGSGIFGYSHTISDLVLILVLVVALIGSFIATEEKSKKPSKKAIKTIPQPPKAVKKTGNKSAKKTTSVFVAAKNGNTFHKPDCFVARRIKKEDKVTFTSIATAEKAGYRSCRACLAKK